MVATFFQNGHKPRTATLPHQQIAQNHRQRVKDLLPNWTVGYSPDLARIVGGATTGLFLSRAVLIHANLRFANLDGADLRFANLSGAKEWTNEQLAQAEFLAGATLPDRTVMTEEAWEKFKKRYGQ